MDNSFKDDERLFRAVYPPEHPGMFWKEDGSLSPSAFVSRNGACSVDRGNYRDSRIVIEDMKSRFKGCIVSVGVGDCRNSEAVVKYSPTTNIYHSEIYGAEDVVKLTRKQRTELARVAKKEYMGE